ncbi:14605_t:CDS:1, partial [Racocetra persica]
HQHESAKKLVEEEREQFVSLWEAADTEATRLKKRAQKLLMERNASR